VKEGSNVLIGTLIVKPKGKAKTKLQKRGKAKLKAKVTYTPAGGAPLRRTKSITLRLAGH
jgi:hypothetical protein